MSMMPLIEVGRHLPRTRLVGNSLNRGQGVASLLLTLDSFVIRRHCPSRSNPVEVARKGGCVYEAHHFGFYDSGTYGGDDGGGYAGPGLCTDRRRGVLARHLSAIGATRRPRVGLLHPIRRMRRLLWCPRRSRTHL